MKRTACLAPVVILALLAVGCGSRAPQTVAVKATPASSPAEPEWINNPTAVPGLVGVGMQPPNVLGNLMMQRKLALGQARQVIAAQLQVVSQGLVAQATETAGTGSSDGKTSTRSQAMTDTANDTLREALNVSLAGATPRQFWTNPETKYLYVLVVLYPDAANRAIKAGATAAIRKEMAEGEKGLDQALDRLDQALARSGGQ